MVRLVGALGLVMVGHCGQSERLGSKGDSDWSCGLQKKTERLETGFLPPEEIAQGAAEAQKENRAILDETIP